MEYRITNSAKLDNLNTCNQLQQDTHLGYVLFSNNKAFSITIRFLNMNVRKYSRIKYNGIKDRIKKKCHITHYRWMDGWMLILSIY